MKDISQWLDTETRQILCSDYSKGTLCATDCYSLLLIAKGLDRSRIESVLTNLQTYGTPNATTYRFVLRQGMSLNEALQGQFALVSCDCATAFVRDEVVSHFSRSDFHQLFQELRASPEFQPVNVRIESIPGGEAGRQFLWQFLGLAVGVALPLHITVMRKKARLMEHCGARIAGVIEIQ